MSLPTKTIISFATRWGPQFGGINSFNQDLLKSFAAAFSQDINTVCVVLQANEAELQDANNSQVTLVSLNLTNEKNFSPEFAVNAWNELPEHLKNESNQIVWLGHDRITGDVAVNSALRYRGRSALINHMSYDHYESFCENSALANEKNKAQRKLFEQADIVMAVGPLLRDALAEMLDREDIPMLIPGLADITVKNIFKTFRGFISGRLSDDAKKIKQGHLGVAAFARAICKADSNSGLPDVLRGTKEPELTLRGVDYEQSNSQDHTNAELELKQFAETHAGRAIRMHALPFTTERFDLFDDLRSASVAMMPSWHEGFGLVGWEAIAAGVPLIVSQKSGLYRFLSELEAGLYTSFVYPIDIAGSNAEPFFQEKDQEALADKIIEIAKSHSIAQQKAIRLREELLKNYTWKDCVLELAKILNWGHTASHCVEKALPIDILIQPETPNNILGLPIPTWKIEAGLSSSRLLRAEEAVIPFDKNREPFLEELIQWAFSTDYPIAIKLLTGVGGTGKTRLSLELCNRLQTQGWQVGFLANDDRIANIVSGLIGSKQQICLVIDYAETRQSQLLELIKAFKSKNLSVQIRILLLARDSGEWWSLLPGKDPTCETLLDSLATTGPYRLLPLHESVESRKIAYQTAMEAFADKLKRPQHPSIPNLHDEHFGHPLYVQMAALLALHGEVPGSAESVARSLINHERRYWTQALSTISNLFMQQDDSPALFMALATLVNGFATARDCEMLWAKYLGDISILKPLFTLLAPLYPNRQGIQGLQPDLLGEALITQCLLGIKGEKLLHAILGSNNPKWRRSSLTVLARILRNREEISSIIKPVLTTHFVNCADDLVAVMVETPSPLAQVVEQAFISLNSPQKNQACGILDKHIQYEVLPLIDLAVLVRQAQVNKENSRLKKITNETQKSLAGALINLSNSFVQQGNIDEGAKTAKRALDIFEKLAKAKPERFEPAFATALSNYSNILSEFDRAEDAEIAAKQALDIRQKLAKAKPEIFEPALATSLSNYAVRLSELGYAEDAKIAAKQALDIREKLAKAKPDLFEPDWATSLGNYANHLGELGYAEEAEKTAKQALAILEKLAKAKPERFEHDWASFLGNYTNHLNNLGRIEESEITIKQALNIFKKLATAKPERFEPDWANSLNNYVCLLNGLGHFEAAEIAAKQALVIRERLAKAKPKQFEFKWLRSKMLVMRCNILTGKQPLEIERITTLHTSSRKKLELSFQEHFLSSFTTYEPELIRDSITKAEANWSKMDATQKRASETERLLLAGLAESKQIVCNLTYHWQQDLERFRAQRNGRLPCWMLEMARLAGFTL